MEDAEGITPDRLPKSESENNCSRTFQARSDKIRPNAEALRHRIHAELSHWHDTINADLAAFIAGRAVFTDRTIAGKSMVTTGLSVIAQIGARRVDDDGVCASNRGVFMVRIVVRVNPNIASGALRTQQMTITITIEEAMAWRAALLPKATPIYLLQPAEDLCQTSARRWHFAHFFTSDGQRLSAPSDFDWAKHRVAAQSLSVSEIDTGGSLVESVYIKRSFHTYYQPHTESRGRYWTPRIVAPEPSSGVTKTFSRLAKDIARRGIIDEAIRPLELAWKHDCTVELTTYNRNSRTCHKVSFPIPTDSELTEGRFLLQPNLGDISDYITSPEQFSAGIISRMSRLIALRAAPIDCPESLSLDW